MSKQKCSKCKEEKDLSEFSGGNFSVFSLLSAPINIIKFVIIEKKKNEDIYTR